MTSRCLNPSAAAKASDSDHSSDWVLLHVVPSSIRADPALCSYLSARTEACCSSPKGCCTKKTVLSSTHCPRFPSSSTPARSPWSAFGGSVLAATKPGRISPLQEGTLAARAGCSWSTDSTSKTIQSVEPHATSLPSIFRRVHRSGWKEPSGQGHGALHLPNPTQFATLQIICPKPIPEILPI